MVARCVHSEFTVFAICDNIARIASWCILSRTVELFCCRLVTGDKMWIYLWAPLSKLEFVQWKDVDHTFTQIYNSAINWLDCCNSCSGIQTDCLWQTICILERQLLVSITQNQHSSCSMSSGRNSDKSCHLGVWLFHENALAHRSLVAQQALQNCEFVQLNRPAYILDLAASNYFLIRNLKYCLLGTWSIDDESLKVAVKAWSESQNRKFKILLSRHKQLRKNVENMHWCCMRICQKNDSMCDIIC